MVSQGAYGWRMECISINKGEEKREGKAKKDIYKENMHLMSPKERVPIKGKSSDGLPKGSSVSNMMPRVAELSRI